MNLRTPVLNQLFSCFRFIALPMILSAIWTAPVGAETLQLLKRESLTVAYSPGGDADARALAVRFPDLSRELEDVFGWPISFHTTILLVEKRERFQRMAGHPAFVAFAVPLENLMVIDTSRMDRKPFTLNVSVKHELCHLLLHDHIAPQRLPRWLDEGVCQWASDGFSEIIGTSGPSPLAAAAAADRLIPFSRLSRRFPSGTDDLRLAYEQSRSLVDYISRVYGKESLLSVLSRLKYGEPIETALAGSLSASMAQLEQNWRMQLKKRFSWWAIAAANLYGILFFLAAVLTVIGFVLQVMKKRRSSLDDDEDEPDDMRHG